ncbi:MAG: hypothetical protein V4696_12775 [Pseudomonadota bacterium]
MTEDMEIPEEFRTKKRNLLWFSLTGIVLFISNADRRDAVKVPTLDIEISTIALAIGFSFCIAYTWYGFWSEVKIIEERHKEAGWKGSHPNFEERYKAIATQLKDHANAIERKWDDAQFEHENYPDHFRIFENAIRTGKESWAKLHDDFLHDESSFVEALPTPRFNQVIDIGSILENLDGAGGNLAHELTGRINRERSLRKRADNQVGPINTLAIQVAKLGETLTRLSEQVSLRRQRQFRFYDVWPTHAVAAAALFASIASVSAAAIAFKEEPAGTVGGTIQGTEANKATKFRQIGRD